jgi:hypothetical protein
VQSIGRQKTLEDTNLKLGDVATDIMGKSARAMLEALLAGQTDPAKLADLARGRLKAKRAQLEAALVGVLKPHHRFMLTEHLSLIDTLDEAIMRASQEIAQRLDPPPDPAKADASQAAPDQQPGAEPETSDREDQEQEQDPPSLTWGQAIVLLCSIPGISQRAARAASWRKLASTCRAFLLRVISLRGQACAQAIVRVQANGSVGGRPRAVPGYANSWWKLLMPQLIPSRPICQRNIIAWLGDEARRKR